MLVILPISRADSELGLRLANYISALGGGAAHHLLVAPSIEKREVGEQILNTLSGSFASSRLFVPEQEHELGWPSSANFMFKKAVGYAYARGNRLPFFWMEADNVPTKPSWLDDLQTEYNLAQKPFMGVVEKTLVRDYVGVVIKTDGEHMNGSGIYPPNFVQKSMLFDSIHTHKEGLPWDIYLRWEMKGAIHNSKQMINNWNSKDYVRTSDGQIACTAIDPNHPGKYVTDSIAIVHGCKDTSLLDLLERERSKPKKVKA